MTVRVTTLPAAFPHGGVVFLRSSSGYSGRTVDDFSEFTFDFEYKPDLFLNGYDRLGLVVGEKEYQFPFCVALNSVLELDFRQSEAVPLPPS